MKKLIILLTLLLAASGVNVTASAAANDKHDSRHSRNFYGRGHGNAKQQKEWFKQEQKIHKQHLKHERKLHKEHEKTQRMNNRRLREMVGRATYGARDVNVWQIDRYTYIVRFHRGGRWYTQKIYPYGGRYGELYEINSRWTPEKPWININISL